MTIGVCRRNGRVVITEVGLVSHTGMDLVINRPPDQGGQTRQPPAVNGTTQTILNNHRIPRLFIGTVFKG